MAKCKIRVTETSKRIIPLADVERVNEMLRKLREDEMEQAIPDYLHIVMDCIKPYSGNWEYYNIRAEVCKNRRVDWNYYTENSGDYDVWVEWYAFNAHDGFFTVGICLSDIFSITAETGKEIYQYAYIREYKEA